VPNAALLGIILLEVHLNSWHSHQNFNLYQTNQYRPRLVDIYKIHEMTHKNKYINSECTLRQTIFLPFFLLSLFLVDQSAGILPKEQDELSAFHS
jgi:hypothetical protein